MAIASLVLGILAALICWVPFLGLLAVPVGLLGLLFGVIAIVLVAAAGRPVYASMSDTLRVLDLSDPTRPKDVGACGGLELAGRVTIAGDYAYVAADFNGMRIIDVSDPAKPVPDCQTPPSRHSGAVLWAATRTSVWAS